MQDEIVGIMERVGDIFHDMRALVEALLIKGKGV